MTHKEFIEVIAKYVIKYADDYGIKVHSPIIAQAILEEPMSNAAIKSSALLGIFYLRFQYV